MVQAHLRDRRRKDNNFVEFTDSLHELIYARSFYDVHIMIVALNFDRDGEVRLVQNLQCGLASVKALWAIETDFERAVNEGFVQIQD